MAAADSVHATRRNAHRAKPASLIHRDESSVCTPTVQTLKYRTMCESRMKSKPKRIKDVDPPFQDLGVGAAGGPAPALLHLTLHPSCHRRPSMAPPTLRTARQMPQVVDAMLTNQIAHRWSGRF